MKKILLTIAKTTSIIVGIIYLAFSIFVLIDPVGTKMADDADPFGKPANLSSSIIMIIVSILLIVWPFVQNNFQSKNKKPSITGHCN